MISKKKLALVLFSLVISIFLLEIGVRLFLPATPLHTGYTLNSDHLVDQALQRTKEKPPEKPVPVRIKTRRDYILTSPTFDTTENFLESEAERWGDTETNKTKILVIGDSHTQNIKNHEPAWADYLEKRFQDTEVFSLGLGGAGATQEYILLNQSINIIKPDIILWQFCHNDYSNDNYRHNRAHWPFTGNSIEPYLIDNKIEYRRPSPLSNLQRQFKTVDFILSKFQTLVFQAPRNSKFRRLIRKHLTRDIPLNYQNTELMIEKSINQTRKRGAKFYLIEINGPQGSQDNYRTCKHINAVCIKGIDQYVIEKGKELNVSVDKGDSHWNTEGNKIAGEYLTQYFKNHSTLETEISKNSSSR